MTEVRLLVGADELAQAVGPGLAARDAPTPPAGVARPAARVVYVVTSVDAADPEIRAGLDRLARSGVVVSSPGPTTGTACSALLAIDHLHPDEEAVVQRGHTAHEAERDAIARLRARPDVVAAWIDRGADDVWRVRRASGEVHESVQPGLTRAGRCELAWFRQARALVEAAFDAIRSQPPEAGPVGLSRLFDDPAPGRREDVQLPSTRPHADRPSR